MTNRKRFFINGMLLTAVGLAIRTVSLGFNSYVSQSIGAEGMGLFTLLGTVYSFAVTFALSGIGLTVTRLVSAAIGEGKEGSVRKILRSSVVYSLIFSISATLVLLFGAEYFSIRVLGDVRCITPLRILALSLCPMALSAVFSGYFVGVKRVVKNATVQVAGQVFKICVTLVLLFHLDKLGVSAGIIALTLSTTLTELAVFTVALLELLIDKRRYKRGSSECDGGFSSVASMALPLAVSAYIRSALLTLEHILIPKRLCDRGDTHAEALASYGILHGMALPVLLYPMSPLSSFSQLLVPEFSEAMARGEERRMRRIASEAINTTLVYSIAAAVILALFSENIGYTVYNSYAAGRYIAIMAPVLPIMYLDHITDSMLKGIGEQVYSMWVNISDSLLSVILVWFLIPKLGILGYAVVIVVMEGYNFTLSALRLRRKISFKINPVRALLLPAALALAAGTAAKQLFTLGGAYTAPVWLFLEILFTVCLFLVMYLAVKLLLDLRQKGKPCTE